VLRGAVPSQATGVGIGICVVGGDFNVSNSRDERP
jgi:hypothetical protein